MSRRGWRTAVAGLALAAGATAPLAAQQDEGAAIDSAYAAILASRLDTGTTFQVVPVVFVGPLTGLAFGAATLEVGRRTTDTGTRPSVKQAQLIYTTKDQVQLSFEADLWSFRNEAGLSARLEYQLFPMPFYGIGPATSPLALETYTSQRLMFTALLQRKVAPALYLQAGWRVVDQVIARTEAGGALAPGTLSGSRGGSIVGLDLGAKLDTRESGFSPTRGALVQARVQRAEPAIGSSFGFTRLGLDARGYVPLRRSTTLALHATADQADGDVPFDQLPMVDGFGSMRGYVPGRFRDRVLVTAQAELRQRLVWRLGAVVFGGGGAVGPRFGALGPWQPSVGAGIRFAILPKVGANLRVDVGIGRGERAVKVSFGEAF
ncbi:MAG: BamA/TamA family outer membrane protein [Gemmatimonadales bacterium]|nr:BamA/TamA family outer membrane protein [Gemmatimonadales bacterium]